MHKLFFAGAFSMVLATVALAQTNQNLNALPGQSGAADQQPMGGQMTGQQGGTYKNRQGGSHQMQKSKAGTDHVQKQKGTHRMQANKRHRKSSMHQRNQNTSPFQTRPHSQTQPQY